MALTQHRIPFNRPYLTGNEVSYMTQALLAPGADGPFTHQCSRLLESILGVPRALLTTSCTAALEMCAILLNIKPGDEVILPSYTFVSTANAFVLRGAVPVFIDIRADTLNIDEALIESAITSRTRAIVVVHYAGVACDMDVIMDISHRRGIPVVEDNAHGLFGSYKGKALGTFGALSTLSFHETKNITCGEGGALIINDPSYIPRAEIIRQKGTNRSQFTAGLVDKYTWVDIGSSYAMSDVSAAYLFSQLESHYGIQARRRLAWMNYHALLWPRFHNYFPWSHNIHEQSCHMFYLKLKDQATRDRLIVHLSDHDILAVFHYPPLHRSVIGLGCVRAHCPITDFISSRLLRLPFYTSITPTDQSSVCSALTAFTL